MTPTRLLQLITALQAMIIAGLAIHTPVSVWLGTQLPMAGDGIKAWKEIIMGACLLLLVVVVSKQRMWTELARDTIIRIVAAYGVLHILLLMWRHQGFEAAVAGMLIDLRYVLFFVLVYVTVKLYPRARRVLISAAVASAAIIIGFACLQVTVLPKDILASIGYSKATIMPYLTVDLNHEFIRINSTLRGPNPLGAYAGALLAFIVAYGIRHRRTLRRCTWWLLGLFAAGGAVTLWVSYSRSALVAGVISVGVVCLASLQKARTVKLWMMGLTLALVIAAGGIVAARDVPFVSNVFFHNNPAGGSAVKSDDDHYTSLKHGIEEVAGEPLGNGIGSTGSASLRGDEPRIIENQYLFTAHESGWLGLLLYGLLFTYCMIQAWRLRRDWVALGVFGSGIGLALIGILLPVWVDDTVSIVWWGMMALALGGKEWHNDRKKRTRK